MNLSPATRSRIVLLGIVLLASAAIFASMHRASAQKQEEPKIVNTTATSTPYNANFVKPSADELKKKLTPIQFQVTQQAGTEPPFRNEFNGNHKAGLYVDVVSGEPLFSSVDKFESGTGWPSFTKPLAKESVVEKKDKSFFGTRTEIRSAKADSHLGHVFDDGPAPTGMRYCMNSAALRFIPVENLKDEGYGDYVKLFESKK